MDDAELTRYVIHRLGDGVGRADVIHEVCERSGKTWPEAERFVDDVASADQEQIAGRTFPILLVISIGTIITGVAILGLLASTLFEALNAAGRSHSALVWAVVVAWMAQNASALPLAGMGLAMVAGGLVGLVRAAENL